jgi:hypothetical protein
MLLQQPAMIVVLFTGGNDIIGGDNLSEGDFQTPMCK